MKQPNSFAKPNLLIFRSNIRTRGDLKVVDDIFSRLNAVRRWSVDLDDWEHVLKVEASILSHTNVACLLRPYGFDCSELDH